MWNFKELSNIEPEVNPHETEFFQDLDVADALVRENVQNSLDARVSDQTPVLRRGSDFRYVFEHKRPLFRKFIPTFANK